MRRKIITLFAVSALAAPAVWADTDVDVNTEEPNVNTYGEPGTAGDNTAVTVQSEDELTSGLRDEVFGFKPQAGVVAYTDARGETTSRLAVGLTLDWNLVSTFMGDNSTAKNWFMGPSTGLIYSHLGSPGSNFVGTDASVPVQAGANFFEIPLNLKAGVNLMDNVRLSAHGGGNLFYRTIANSIQAGSSSASLDSDWTIFPNIGGDVELGLGKSAALILRPDFTITPGDDVFTGTVGFSAPLG